MNGKDHQRGSIEKDGNRQRNSETNQDEETTISQIQLIEGKQKAEDPVADQEIPGQLT